MSYSLSADMITYQVVEFSIKYSSGYSMRERLTANSRIIIKILEGYPDIAHTAYDICLETN